MTQQGKDWDQLLGRPPWVCGSLEKISNQNPGFLAPPSFLLRNNFTKGFSFNKGSRTGHVTFIHQSLSAFFPQHLHLGCFFLRSWEPPLHSTMPRQYPLGGKRLAKLLPWLRRRGRTSQTKSAPFPCSSNTSLTCQSCRSWACG